MFTRESKRQCRKLQQFTIEPSKYGNDISNCQYFISNILQQGYSITNFSKSIQIHDSTLRRILTGKSHKPRANTVKRILQIYCATLIGE